MDGLQKRRRSMLSLLYQHPLFKIEKKGVTEPAVLEYRFLWHCAVYALTPRFQVVIVLWSIFSWLWRHEIACSCLGILVIRTLVRINDLQPPLESVAGSLQRPVSEWLYLHVVIVVYVVHCSGHVVLHNMTMTMTICICICPLPASSDITPPSRMRSLGALGFPRRFVRRVLRRSPRPTSMHQSASKFPSRHVSKRRELPVSSTKMTFAARSFAARSFAASLSALIAAIVLFSGKTVDATALTYKIDANERACFYAWVDKVGEKIAFYFAVSPR